MRVMIMKAVNDLLNKDKNNEIAVETNQMSLAAPEIAIINKRIYEQESKKVNPSKVYLWN